MIRSKEVMRAKGINIGKPEMSHMTITPLKGGGAKVEHHFQGGGAKVHTFKTGEGGNFQDHIMKNPSFSWADGSGDHAQVNKQGIEAE